MVDCGLWVKIRPLKSADTTDCRLVRAGYLVDTPSSMSQSVVPALQSTKHCGFLPGQNASAGLVPGCQTFGVAAGVVHFSVVPILFTVTHHSVPLSHDGSADFAEDVANDSGVEN